MQQCVKNVYKNKPRPIGEVIKDLIREGLILPNYKYDNNEYSKR